MAGYALARLKFRSRVMFVMILGTLMIPGVVLLIPRFILLKQLGLIGTYQGYIYHPGRRCVRYLPDETVLRVFRVKLREAASGRCESLHTFFRIVLPMATPALTALTIF